MVNATITVWVYATASLAALLLLVVGAQTAAHLVTALLGRVRTRKTAALRIFELPARAASAPAPRAYAADRQPARVAS